MKNVADAGKMTEKLTRITVDVFGLECAAFHDDDGETSNGWYITQRQQYFTKLALQHKYTYRNLLNNHPLSKLQVQSYSMLAFIGGVCSGEYGD